MKEIVEYSDKYANTAQPDKTKVSDTTAKGDNKTDVIVSPKLFIFIIYYQSPNPKNDTNLSFKKASDFLKKRYSINSFKDCECLVNVFSSNTEFYALWLKIYQLSQKDDNIVQRIHILCHSSKWDSAAPNTIYGLGSAVVEENGSFRAATISLKEIEAFSAVKYHSDGKLIIHACNSGLRVPEYKMKTVNVVVGAYGMGRVPMRVPVQVEDKSNPIYHECIAECFSKTQSCIVIGQSGYAYFSSVRDKHSRITEGKTPDYDIYLWAYYRRGNVAKSKNLIGNNAIMRCNNYSKGKLYNTGGDTSYM